MNKKYIFGLFLGILLVVQLACNAATAPPSTPNTIATLDGLYTAAAQTSTPISIPTSTPTVTPGLPVPTASPIQPLPTSTPFVLPTNTPRPIPCDAASFVKDVSIPDGSVIGRSADFIKTWRLKNIGTCTWTKSYDLVFVRGDSMSGPTVVALPTAVSPGQSIDLSVTLTAPSKDGNYRGYWKLRNASNILFGIGVDADNEFWVDIVVQGTAYTAYSFVNKYCDAEWNNNSAALACPGTSGDDQGYVIRIANPKLENGTTSQNPGLLTVPKNSRNGLISGTYPAMTIQAGDHFRSWIQCRVNAENCDVIFRLDFRSGGKTSTLGTWEEVNDGRDYSIDLDLSALAGQRGKFILVVETNGPARDDQALWIAPRLIRYSDAPD